MSLSVAPLTTTVMNSVDVVFEGAASGINNAVSRVAAVVAVALFGVVFAYMFNASLRNDLVRANLPPIVFQAIDQQRSKLAAIELPVNINDSVKVAAQDAIAESFVYGFRWIMFISALLALVGAGTSWMLIENVGGKTLKSSRRTSNMH